MSTNFDSLVETELSAVLSDSSFLSNLGTGWIKNVSDKKELVKVAIECMFVKPRGVGQIPLLKSAGIRNREWADFCTRLRGKIDRGSMSRLSELSPLVKEFGTAWPECSSQIEARILSLKEDVKKQQEIQNILNNTVPDDKPSLGK